MPEALRTYRPARCAGIEHLRPCLGDLRDAQTKAVLKLQCDCAKAGPAQRERILRAGGPLIDREEADQAVQLVRQAHRHRHRRGRHLVALPDRLVMVADGVGDGVGLALRAAR